MATDRSGDKELVSLPQRHVPQVRRNQMTAVLACGSVRLLLVMFDLDNDGYSSRASMFEVIATALNHPDPGALLLSYHERVIQLAAVTRGACDCLVALRGSGHRLAIVTDGSSKQQNAKVDQLGRRELVDAVVVSEEVRIKKPDRRIFDHTAALAAGSLEDAWMVGDAVVHDIQGAQRIGVRTAWISRRRQWDPSKPPPDVVVECPADLIRHTDLR